MPTFFTPGIPHWPSRDPIGERGGVNLYGFVGNDGVNTWDLLGLLEGDVSYNGKLIGKIQASELAYSNGGYVVNRAADANGVAISIDFTFNKNVTEKGCGCQKMKFIQFLKTNVLHAASTKSGISVDSSTKDSVYYAAVYMSGQTVPKDLPTGGTIVSSYTRMVDTPFRFDDNAQLLKSDLYWTAYAFVVCIKERDRSPENSRNWSSGNVGALLLSGVKWGFTRKYDQKTNSWEAPEKVGPSLINNYDDITLENMKSAIDIHASNFRGVVTGNTLNIQEAPFFLR